MGCANFTTIAKLLETFRRFVDALMIPEIGLGIGRVQGLLSGIAMEWLTWFDRLGQPYPLPEEVIENLRAKVRQQQGRIAKLERLAEQERLDAERERSARLQLIDRLKQLGIDSNLLDN